MKIDITFSVFLKSAVQECEIFINEIMEKYKIPEDMKEIILENLLSKSREEKLNLYSSVILKNYLGEKEEKGDD